VLTYGAVAKAQKRAWTPVRELIGTSGEVVDFRE
jgi:hypothetical protein